MSFYNWPVINKIQMSLYEDGIPGSKLRGTEWKEYGKILFENEEWDFLDKDQKCAILEYRYFLIVNQQRKLTNEEDKKFKSIVNFISENDLEKIDLPDEYNTMESFLIDLAIGEASDSK